MSVEVTTHYLPLPTGETVFYRTAGTQNKATVLLLHGFPSSSHQYRKLIPLLAERYRVIAPDLPGFGFTSVPDDYKYTFKSLTETTKSFLKTIPNPPSEYAIYIFSFGGPIGLRLALSNPTAVTAIIAQSGNAYEEGLAPFWDPLKKYWESGSREDREALLWLFKPESTKFQYTEGTKDLETIAPESYTLDQARLDRPGIHEILLDLFYDYRTNVELYPAFQEYFRKTQVALIAIWGEHDFIFGTAGAEAFKKDLPKVEVQIIDAGHFPAETNTHEVAKLILEFFEKYHI